MRVAKSISKYIKYINKYTSSSYYAPTILLCHLATVCFHYAILSHAINNSVDIHDYVYETRQFNSDFLKNVTESTFQSRNHKFHPSPRKYYHHVDADQTILPCASTRRVQLNKEPGEYMLPWSHNYKHIPSQISMAYKPTSVKSLRATNMHNLRLIYRYSKMSTTHAIPKYKNKMRNKFSNYKVYTTYSIRSKHNSNTPSLRTNDVAKAGRKTLYLLTNKQAILLANKNHQNVKP